MKNLSIIAAIGRNRELGYNNKLIWHIKEDLAFYKKMTMNKNIIMGRLTLESMPSVALIGRNVIVLTHSNFNFDKEITCYNSLNDLLEVIKASDEEYMVVGGASIYKQFLPFVDTMYLTTIDDNFIHLVDSWFPEFDINDWNIETFLEGNQEEINYQINKYIRKKQKNTSKS